MNELLVLTIVMFLAGLFFTLNYKNSDLKETFDTIEDSLNKQSNDDEDSNENKSARCPNLLVKDGNRFYLKNTNLAEVPGVNPISFENLDEYTDFLKWQRSQGINCPILYLEKEYSAQGKASYRMRSSGPENPGQAVPFDIPEEKGGYYADTTLLMDAGRDDPPYNSDSYPGFDPGNQYIGVYTPLDKMFKDDGEKSPNAMDTNWGGVAYTQSVVDRHYHKHHHVADNE